MSQNLRIILILINVGLYGFIAAYRLTLGEFDSLSSTLLPISLIFTVVLLFFAKRPVNKKDLQ